jgi:hypothetical protein
MINDASKMQSQFLMVVAETPRELLNAIRNDKYKFHIADYLNMKQPNHGLVIQHGVLFLEGAPRQNHVLASEGAEWLIEGFE